MERISRNPELHAVIYRGVRRCLVRRFPYAILYMAEETRVVVIAVMHTRRNPQRWKKRI
jgi:toxin ParE1/3/4